ncbi:MAG: hypothetical protein R3Y67_07010 [Eubacteriales bacterium]
MAKLLAIAIKRNTTVITILSGSNLYFMANMSRTMNAINNHPIGHNEPYNS